MSDDQREPLSVTREAVASFARRNQFPDAVGRLLAAGFQPADLSVLASHDSIEVAGIPAKPNENLLAGLTDEVNFLAPLTLAGFVLVSGGPIAAAIAALVGAGIG